MASLGIEHVYQGRRDKLPAFEDLLGKLGLSADEVAFVGDDVVDQVMTRGCVTAAATDLAAGALHLMESHSINGLLVVDPQGRPVGALNMHDLLRAGVL
jgi:arabinose-5-phosphate isomerase